MKGVFSKVLPHLIAIVIFLIVALLYCRPALEGKVVTQHDVTHWQGSIKQSEVYNETHGNYPLWTNALFSGMPTFQIGGLEGNYLGAYVHTILTVGLPKPIQFFFLASICFYFLCMMLRCRPWVGVLGALGFAYATYNPVIIATGHDTKMWAMAYMPALLGSVILIYERRYWLGLALTAIFTSTLIAMNHPQIAYYLFLVIAVMSIFYIARWIRNGELKHMGIALGSTLVAALIGVLTNAVVLFSTYEYQKYTIRGGPSELTDTTRKDDAKNGLDKEYAFSYSMGISEPFVMLVPRMYGGSDNNMEISEEKSKTIEKVRAMPQEAQQFLFQNLSFLFSQTQDQELYARMYWGGIGSASGPVYVGAIMVFLAILAMFVLDGKHKWWALTAIVLAIFMSWGSYFDSFNTILYKYLPLYNKFRAPSMIMVIPQLLIPFLAALGVERIASTTDRKSLMPKFKYALYTMGGIFVILFGMYATFEFMSEGNKEVLKYFREQNQAQLITLLNDLFNGLKEDRQSLMLTDIFRSLGFIAAAVVAIWLWLRNTISSVVAIVGLTVLSLIDLLTIDSIYLNANKYKDPIENEANFVRTPADEQLLADKSFFRVYNVGGDRFQENITSYHYNSVGGYHPAKLVIYQDLIEKQLSKGNEKVLDMLNTKYLIQKDQDGKTTGSQPRPTALGAVWFIKGIRYVKNADEEMAALDNFNPRDTAIVQEKFKSNIPFTPSADSAATIQLVKNDNDQIEYTSQSSTDQFAVFSEIFYDAGWKATIDGKETPIVKVNYVLRGLAVPKGNHKIEFRFEPQGYLTGKKLTQIFSIIAILIFLGGLFMEWRNRKNRSAEVSRA